MEKQGICPPDAPFFVNGSNNPFLNNALISGPADGYQITDYSLSSEYIMPRCISCGQGKYFNTTNGECEICDGDYRSKSVIGQGDTPNDGCRTGCGPGKEMDGDSTTGFYCTVCDIFIQPVYPAFNIMFTMSIRYIYNRSYNM